MKKTKWYERVLIIAVLIILSPLIIFFLLSAGIGVLFKYPKIKRAYKKSIYYKDFGKKFSMGMMGIIDSPQYRFYNEAIARKLPIRYIVQETNSFEYFIYNDTIFLFPDFDQLYWDEETRQWQVNFDGTEQSFEQAYADLLSKLDNQKSTPVKLLVERAMIPTADLNKVILPEEVFVTWKYENAFENDDSPLKMIVPQNIYDIYEMMLQTPDLCGSFELAMDGESIEWKLTDKISIELGINKGNCYVGIHKRLFGKTGSQITHWHPGFYEIYNDVCNIGTRGNVLVIRSSLLYEAVLYMGPKADCPYSPGKKSLLGKLYYIEAL